MATFIDFPVKSRDDWEKMKKRFNPEDERRYPITWSEELLDYYKTVDHPVSLSMTGFFGEARHLMGLERLLVTFYKDPDLIHDIMDFWADFLIETSRNALREAKIDFVTIWEDMAYKRGPHISPRFFRDFMLPNYRKVTDFVRKHGIDIIMVDTDGNHEAITQLFLEGGVNCLYPVEVASGMDAVKLRETYGRQLLLIGNIDKRALAHGREAIKREVERTSPLLEEGGYLPSVDHAVPSDVPFKNYAYYISLIKSRL
ncbi:MAG: uroporphyrinogen decarboxylase family protein, partial [Candidatus Bathyarchaeia archaeon]